MTLSEGREARQVEPQATSRRDGLRIAIVAGIFGTVSALIANPWWPGLVFHTMHTRACGQSGNDARIDAPSAIGMTGAYTVTVYCQPTSGQHLEVMVEIPDVDPGNPHPGFYPKDDLPGPGQYTFEMDLSKAESGSVRELYIVMFDDTAYHELSQNEAEDGTVLQLPDGSRVISNVASVKKY